MAWQSAYSSGGPFGIGAGPYSMDMEGDKMQRGMPGEHPSLPNAPTAADFARAVMDGFNKGGSIAVPGMQPGMLSGPLSALSEIRGQQNAPVSPAKGSAMNFGLNEMAPRSAAPKGGLESLLEALGGAFSGNGPSLGGAPGGGNIGLDLGALG